MPGLKDPAGLQIVSPVLTNVAINYRVEGFIYDRLVSFQSVATNIGQYPVWSAADFRRSGNTNSAVDDRAETPEIDASYSLQDYALKNYRLKVSITPEERQQAHTALRLETQKVQLLMDQMAIRREVRLAAILRKTTNGGQLTLGGNATSSWSTASTGRVIENDIRTARQAIRNATGQSVDTIVIPWDVAYAIALNPEIREVIKYTAPSGAEVLRLGDLVLPAVLHGLRVVVPNVMANTAAEGATESLSDAWGTSVRLLKTAPDGAWGKPATVYALRGVVGNRTVQPRTSVGPAGEPAGWALVDRWATADPPVDYVRAWEKVQEKVVAPDVGYEIANTI